MLCDEPIGNKIQIFGFEIIEKKTCKIFSPQPDQFNSVNDLHFGWRPI